MTIPSPPRPGGERKQIFLSLAAISLIAFASVGCFSRGGIIAGHGYSDDRYTYWSEPWAPKTISLIDTRTDETIWSVDVPVGKQLVVRFREGKGEGEHMPDLMQWGLMERGAMFGGLDNQMPAPDRFTRKLEMSLRPRPESAEEETPTSSAPGGEENTAEAPAAESPSEAATDDGSE